MAAVVEAPAEPPQLKLFDSQCVAEEKEEEAQTQQKFSNDIHQLLASYLGLSFSVFLSLLPKSALSLIPTLQSRNNRLSLRLHHAEEQLLQLKSRRQEDSRANARVVEIFASHRNEWQQAERRLLHQIDDSNEEVARLHDEIERLRDRVAELERNESNLFAELEELKKAVGERDELLNFMSRKPAMDAAVDVGMGGENVPFVGGNVDYFAGSGGGVRGVEGIGSVMEVKECIGERERNGDFGFNFGRYNVDANGLDPDLLPSASKFWAEQASLWQDIQYEPIEPTYHPKHFVARRESPWKINEESMGVTPKLKQLEQELLNLERIGTSDMSNIPAILRKQVKRYQGVAEKIDDLCQRMLANDPCEMSLSSEFRVQRQTEFLVEAYQLQQRASETGQKLASLQTDINSGYIGEELGGTQAKLTARRSMDSIRNNFKEIQRNLEIWLARIIGDLKGILARDGTTRAREYYIPRYHYV